MTTYILLWGSIREPFTKKLLGDEDYLFSYTKGFASLPSPAQVGNGSLHMYVMYRCGVIFMAPDPVRLPVSGIHCKLIKSQIFARFVDDYVRILPDEPMLMRKVTGHVNTLEFFRPSLLSLSLFLFDCLSRSLSFSLSMTPGS